MFSQFLGTILAVHLTCIQVWVTGARPCISKLPLMPHTTLLHTALSRACPSHVPVHVSAQWPGLVDPPGILTFLLSRLSTFPVGWSGHLTVCLVARKESRVFQGHLPQMRLLHGLWERNKNIYSLIRRNHPPSQTRNSGGMGALFWDRVLPCSPGWFQTYNFPSSAFSSAETARMCHHIQLWLYGF